MVQLSGHNVMFIDFNRSCWTKLFSDLFHYVEIHFFGARFVERFSEKFNYTLHISDFTVLFAFQPRA